MQLCLYVCFVLFYSVRVNQKILMEIMTDFSLRFF